MPTTTPEHDERVAKMKFSSVYPHYVTKVEKKGRTKEDLHQVIHWLTGFDDEQLQKPQLLPKSLATDKFYVSPCIFYVFI